MPGTSSIPSSRRASPSSRAPTPSPSTSTIVGASTPAAKPWSAATAASCTSLSAGSPLPRRRASSVWRIPLAAATRPAIVNSATSAATGREVRISAIRERMGESASSSSSSETSSRGRSDGQKTRRPNSARLAGTKVIETASEIAAVRASAGPNARKNSSSPTTRAAVPVTTMRPAVATIGATAVHERRAASSRGVPRASSRRQADRKKIV